VRLYTRRGYNWADRYPRILEALCSLRVRSIVIDGEAVWCGKDGKSDFGKLHSGGHDASVLLYAFDLIELDGEDLRPHHSNSVRASSKSCSRAARGYGSRSTSPATARSSLRTHASLASKASFRSGAIFPTVRADARRGSRSRTRRARSCCASRTGHGGNLSRKGDPVPHQLFTRTKLEHSALSFLRLMFAYAGPARRGHYRGAAKRRIAAALFPVGQDWSS
jgi:hypothetical protein